MNMELVVLGADGREWCESIIRPPPYRGYKVIQRQVNGLVLKNSHASVILSAGILNGQRWIHLSHARTDRLPTWPELVAVRDLVLGEETRCIQIAPPRSQYVNTHPNCLHLWHSPDLDLPDFRDPKTGQI